MKIAVWFAALAAYAAPDAAEIVRRSVAATQADWKAAPQYSFTERDVTSKGVRTYEVLMIEGSPYRRLVAAGDHRLSPAQEAQERRKLEQETARRRREPSQERARRVASYQRERQQDQTMLREMVNAFEFKLAGTAAVNGRQTYLLDASPKPGYKPPNRDAKVLTGMRGRMWVDKSEYRWVKVEAEVIRPVSFAFALAKVSPGTRFVLEQGPVGSNVWMPKRFSVKVNSSVLGWSRKSSSEETYTGYKPSPQSAVARSGP